MRPSSGSQHAFRVATTFNIPRRGPKRAPTVAMTVHIDGAEPGKALRLFVDGIPGRTFTGDTVRADVPRGDHALSVESLDGTVGSQEVPARIEASGVATTLTLWPERSASGHLEIPDPSIAGPGFTLGAIPVVIEPGAISVVTNADGTFVFPKQPMPPQARISIDDGALPRRVRGPAPIALGNDPVTIILQPGVKIEEETFK